MSSYLKRLEMDYYDGILTKKGVDKLKSEYLDLIQSMSDELDSKKDNPIAEKQPTKTNDIVIHKETEILKVFEEIRASIHTIRTYIQFITFTTVVAFLICIIVIVVWTISQ